jgi:hypothetical protein
LGLIVSALQPFVESISLVVAWSVVILALWNIGAAAADSFSRAKRMHKIPCAYCKYFTDNPHLKCPVHPKIAMSEKAINCPDYEEKSALVK